MNEIYLNLIIRMKIFLKLLGFSPLNQARNSTENVRIFSGHEESFPLEEI